MPTTQDLYDDWIANLDRAVLVVDETRERQPTPSGHGVFTLFTSVQLTIEVLNEFLVKMEEERAKLPPEAREKKIKGSDLFGPAMKPRYRRIRTLVRDTLRAGRICRLLTTSNYINESKMVLTGKITSHTGQVIDGPELQPVLNFVKVIGSRITPTPKQIDVVFDRSAQTGSDPSQAGIAKNQFNVAGPAYLNTVSGGGVSTLVCPSLFRIVFGSDDLSGLRELILLPDASGYIELFKDDITTAKAKVLAGEKFWLMESDPTVLSRMATLNVVVGFCGAGKSTLIREFGREGMATMDEGFVAPMNESDAAGRVAILKALNDGRDCAVGSMECSYEPNRQALQRDIAAAAPYATILWHFFAKDRQTADNNCRRDRSRPRDVEGNIAQNARWDTAERPYTIPPGAIVRPIYRLPDDDNSES